ncbi:MAG: rRNA maturation RNase YbeY [Coraliomargaritaceae bacterium]
MTTPKTILPAICNQYERLQNANHATIAILEALEHSGKFPIGNGELSVVFVNDKTIAEIHQRFMDDPTPTDVITFPADPMMESAGEIILSVDHAEARSSEMKIPFSPELSLYLVHGWLHLAGYDDKETEDCRRMREAEKEAMAIIDDHNASHLYSLHES